MNLLDKEDTDCHRVLLFGPPKVGKTELAARLAEHFNLLYFDLENGYLTMRKLPREWQARINLISIADTRDYPIGIETMGKIVKEGEYKICREHSKVACFLCAKDPINKHVEVVNLHATPRDTIVVIDSVTQIANSAMSHITKGKPDDYKYDWTDYTAQGTAMSKFLSNLQVAPYNLVAITHEIEIEQEDGTNKIVPVSGSSNFSRNTAKYFDHVVYCQVKNKAHKFGSSSTYQTNLQTGSRTDIAIENDEVASLLSIFKPGTVQQKKPAVPTPGAQALNLLKEKRDAETKK